MPPPLALSEGEMFSSGPEQGAVLLPQTQFNDSGRELYSCLENKIFSEDRALLRLSVHFPFLHTETGWISLAFHCS